MLRVLTGPEEHERGGVFDDPASYRLTPPRRPVSPRSLAPAFQYRKRDPNKHSREEVEDEASGIGQTEDAGGRACDRGGGCGGRARRSTGTYRPQYEGMG